MRRGFSSLKTREYVAIVVLAAMALFALQSDSQSRKPLASAETRFVEHSTSGMQIVPASCPSDPHYSGECSGAPPAASSGTCVIYADPSPISSGQSSTLSWNVADFAYGDFGTFPPSNIMLSSVGPVARSGSTLVSPAQTTTYTLSGNYLVGDTVLSTFSCFRTVTVTVSVGSCTTSCGTISSGSSATFYLSSSPPSGQSCQPQTRTCTNGTLSGSYTACTCTPPGSSSQCTPQYFCQRNDLYYKNSSCVNSFIQTCAYGCSGSACLSAPAAQVSIIATPSLVRSGETTTITWSGTNVTSCTVTENSPAISDSWSCSGMVSCAPDHVNASSGIVEQTTYTLSCIDLQGATIVDTATVSVIPVFQEI